MAEEEKKKAKKIMIVPPPPANTGDEPIKVVMKGNPDEVIKIVAKEELASTTIVSKPTTEDVALRDENVQEILTSVPHWMIRWGNFLFLGLLLMVIAISWFVKYPDVVNVPLTVVSTNPSAVIVNTEQQEIQDFLVEENQYVTESTPLLVYQNDANIKDVQALQEFLNSIEVNSQALKVSTNEATALKLGSLQVPFAEFQAAYQTYVEDKADKTKFKNVVVSYETLSKALMDWIDKKIVKAPVNGNVKMVATTNGSQADAAILKITSDEKNTYFSKIRSENSEFQKIKKGQEVQVSLLAYPESENGVLLGKIESVDWNAALRKYVVVVSYPEDLKTSYDVSIDSTTNLNGIATIIVERKRLIERFFSSF